jgi:hypothetical protein
MCCRNRCGCRDRDDVAGIQRIALRGPGCISGTGRCEGVLGTGGRCRCNNLLNAAEDFCDQVFGNRGEVCCSNVLGTGGGRFRCGNSNVMGIRSREFNCGNSNVMGTGGGRCGQVFGTGGEFQCSNVAGTGGRRNRCKPSCCDLKTPITVPR